MELICASVRNTLACLYRVKSSQVKQTLLSHIEKLHCGLLNEYTQPTYRNTWAGIKQQSKYYIIYNTKQQKKSAVLSARILPVAIADHQVHTNASSEIPCWPKSDPGQAICMWSCAGRPEKYGSCTPQLSLIFSASSLTAEKNRSPFPRKFCLWLWTWRRMQFWFLHASGLDLCPQLCWRQRFVCFVSFRKSRV